MTPCFLHTPNMTNKWNDFKPPQNSEEGLDPHRHINHQENPSEERPLFIKSGGQQVKVTPEQLAQAVNENIAKQVHVKAKPGTSYHTSKPDKNLNLLMMMNKDSIKLTPQDIYL